MNQSDETDLRQGNQDEQQTIFQWAKGIINDLFQFRRPVNFPAVDAIQDV